MKTYKYSFRKVLVNYWLVFVLPLLAGYAFIRVGVDSWSWVTILPIVLTFAVLAIPLAAIVILLKTEIQITETSLIQKCSSREKTITWNNVSSIERKNIYTISLDKPRDLVIKDKNKNQINIYGFIEDSDDVENDIITYSRMTIIDSDNARMA